MNTRAPISRGVGLRVPLRLIVLIAASSVMLPAVADIPAEAFTNEKLTAADTQRLMYDELVRRGVARELAALATVDTQVVRNEPDHIQFVQTMIGGIRREVDIRLTPGPPRDARRVPLTLNDGSMALAERVAMKRTVNGFSTSGTVYLPNATPSAALLEHWQRQHESPWLPELFGIGTANAQGDVVGMAISYGDSFAGAVGNAVGVQNLTVQGVVDIAKQVSSDPTVEVAKTIGKLADDITEVVEPAVEGPKTLWQSRAETAGDVGKVLSYGYEVYGKINKDAERRNYLKSLRDCANNPTKPTAIKAQKEDPNYRRATTDVIDDGERNLSLNTGLGVFTTTVNTAASEWLKRASPAGAAIAKVVDSLNELEQKLLDHVADEYIMKDVAKGVVPCDCGPVYRPTPPSEEQASYTQAEWSGSSSPDGLVCEAAAVSSNPAQNFTPGPTPAPPSNAADTTCGMLTHASFAYRLDKSSGGCMAEGCQYDREQLQVAGSVPLTVNGTKGYLGSGSGRYSASHSYKVKSSIPCGSSESRGTVEGKVDLTVNAFASIDNSVTGGLDTSTMPRDTSVVEVLFEGQNLHQDNHLTNGCDKSESWGDDEYDLGPTGCYFYGVELHRAGFYAVYLDNDPPSGICTLTLNK
jgi:hypothetical protein